MDQVVSKELPFKRNTRTPQTWGTHKKNLNPPPGQTSFLIMLIMLISFFKIHLVLP